MSNVSLYWKKFARYLTIYALIISAIGGGFRLIAPESIVTPVLFYMIAGFYAVTLIIYIIMVYASREKFSRFHNKFMLSTIIKLILYLVVIVAYVFKFTEDAVNFLITFLVLYVLFTGFEVIFIARTTKKIELEE